MLILRMASEGLTNTAGTWHCAFLVSGITTLKFLLEYRNGCLQSNCRPNLDVKVDQSYQQPGFHLVTAGAGWGGWGGGGEERR